MTMDQSVCSAELALGDADDHHHHHHPDDAITTATTIPTQLSVTRQHSAEATASMTPPPPHREHQPASLPPPCMTSAASASAACFTTADRYGVVFSALLENKMLAIRQESAAGGCCGTDKRKLVADNSTSKSPSTAAGGGVAKTKRSGGGGGLAKTFTLCVRRNSLPTAAECQRAAASTAMAATGSDDRRVGAIELDAVGTTAAVNCGTDTDDLEQLPPPATTDVCVHRTADVESNSQSSAALAAPTTLLLTSDELHRPSATTTTTTYKDCQTAMTPPATHSRPPRSLALPAADAQSAGPAASGSCSQRSSFALPTCVPSSASASASASVSASRSQEPDTANSLHSAPPALPPPPAHQLQPQALPPMQRARTLSTARLHHQRVLEARSISAQASPVLPRTHGASAGRPPAAASGPATSVTITENLIEQRQMGQQMGQSASASADPAAMRFAESLAQSLAAVNAADGRGIRPGRSADSDSSSHGFINNFNELTAHSLSSVVCLNRPVITTMAVAEADQQQQQQQQRQQHFRAGWPCRPRSFDARPSERWIPLDAVAGGSGGAVERYARRTRMALMDGGSGGGGGGGGEESGGGGASDRSAEGGRRMRRKYRHRGSDPVLIYPSSTGLPQCLLSMPPNRSIQIKYDDNTLYDVSLELDRKQAKKDAAARKSGHARHHHHHHHHHRHHHNAHHHPPEADGHHRHGRRHKKRILVHDLDTQKVKVINPDDLPQRARWTIIATACLLFIMCLLLVGVTLRMAPLIDDMVRQENERLQKETLDRSRFVRNLTDAASTAAAALLPVPEPEPADP